MTKDQYIALVGTELTTAFKEFGFSGKNTFWYRKTAIAYQLIELQRSAWGPTFYLNIGLLIKPQESIKRKLSSIHWHYSSRFETIANWDYSKHEQYFSLADEATEEDVKSQAAVISTIFQQEIFPKLDKISSKKYLLSVRFVTCLEEVWFLQNIQSADLLALIRD
jgi:Domain of unknown function (DUF4304)